MAERNWGRASMYGVSIAAGLIALLAFGLRAFRLDGQSFWYDEGISVTLAPRGLDVITLSAAADIHPPLYYYLLHFWTMLSGTSEYGARYLSVLEGVLLIAVVFALGRRLFGSGVGITAALLAATSPFLVYYSQEARMYTQAALLASLSMYAFLRLVEGPKPYRGWKPWLAYLAVSCLAVYSHYYAFTVLLLQNLYVGLWLIQTARLAPAGTRWRAIRAPLAAWPAGQVALLVLYAPWLVVSYRQLLGWPSISEAFGLGELVRRLFLVFSLGLSWDSIATPARELVFIALAAASLLYVLKSPRDRSARSLGIVLLYLSVPVLTMYVASLQRPMYNPKFLLLAAPAYCLLLGVGIDSLRQGLEWAVGRLRVRPVALALGVLLAIGCVGAITVSTSRSLQAYYFDAKYARDDYRGLVQYVEGRWHDGDAVILDAPGQIEIFDLYYQGSSDAVYPLPRTRPMQADQTEAELAEIGEKHGRVWLVLWATKEADPDLLVERWLDGNMYKSDSRWFGALRLAQYSSEGQAGGDGQAAEDLRFGDSIVLREHGPLRWAGEPESTIPVSLTWEGKGKIDGRYKVFVHLLDDGEYLWGQHDAEPGGGFSMTTDWQPGQQVLDRHGLTVLPGTPPGTYRLEIGMYDPTTGQRLQVKDESERDLGDRLLFGEIKVEARAYSQQQWEPTLVPRPTEATFGPLELAGFGLTRLGEDGQQAEYARADVAHLTLFWRAASAPTSDLKVRLELEGADGRRFTVNDVSPGFAQHSTSEWQAGELVRQQSRIRLADIPAGEYAIMVMVEEPSAGSLAGNGARSDGWFELGRLTVRGG